MVDGKKVCVILPAYNAARTLTQTCAESPRGVVDDVVLVDDASRDNTVEIALGLGMHVVRHEDNCGYGGNQKTFSQKWCSDRAALDIVVMLHPDYQ